MSFVIYVDAKTPRKINRIEKVTIKTVNRKAAEIGTTLAQRKSKTIQITDIERTIIDFIADHNLGRDGSSEIDARKDKHSKILNKISNSLGFGFSTLKSYDNRMLRLQLGYKSYYGPNAFVDLDIGYWYCHSVLPLENMSSFGIPRMEKMEYRLKSLFTDMRCRLIRFYHFNNISRMEVINLWKLNEINNGFKIGLETLHTKEKEIGAFSPEQALIEKMVVGDEIVNFLFKDPLLPDQFLPDNWKGEELRNEFHTWDKEVTRISQPYWGKIFE